MNPEELNAIIKRWGLTAKTVAMIAGKSAKTIPGYRNGTKVIPLEIRMSIKELDKYLTSLKTKYSE